MRFPENHWLYQLKADLQKIEPTIQLILYGSRARGDARPDSDWDLLLLTEKNKLSFEEEDAFRTPVYLAELTIGEAFSLQIFTKYAWENKFYITPYYQNIQREGIWV
jgi:uncharacterized protein